MYELLLVACVGKMICEYLASPIHYASYDSCALQAALISGTVSGRNGVPGEQWSYQYSCRVVGTSEVAWSSVEVTEEAATSFDKR